MKKIMIVGLIGVTALNGMNEIIPVQEKYAISRESYKQYYKELPSENILNTMDILSNRVTELDKKKPLTLIDIKHHNRDNCDCSFKLEPVNRGENILHVEALPLFLGKEDIKPYIYPEGCVKMVTGFVRAWLLKRTSGNKMIPALIGLITYTPMCASDWFGQDTKEDREMHNFLGNKKIFAIEYYLRREARGHGIMSAAITELISFIQYFETGDDGYDYLIAGIPADNEKSKTVVKRAGFECVLDEKERQIWVYKLQ